MPIKPEEALSVLGYDSLDSFEKVEDFKTEVSKKYIARDKVHEDEDIRAAIVGKTLGSAENEVIKHFKSVGVEFEPGEVKGKKLSEVVKIGSDKIVTNYTTQLEELKASGGGNTKEFEKITKQLGEYKTKFEQERDLREKAAKELEDSKLGFETEKKNLTIGQQVKELLGAVKYKTAGIPEPMIKTIKTGFESEVKRSYKFDLNDKGELIVLDSNGKQVENAKKVGEYLSPLEAIKNLAVENGVWDENPHRSTPPKNGHLNGSPDSQKPRRTLHSSLGG
jgi:hypothetical protein